VLTLKPLVNGVLPDLQGNIRLSGQMYQVGNSYILENHMSNEDNEKQTVPADIPTGNPGTDNKNAPQPKDLDPVPVKMNNG